MSIYRPALVAAALAAMQLAASAQPSLTATATPGATVVGSTGTVNVSVDVSDPMTLWGATMNLYWDPRLSFDGVSATIFGQSLDQFVTHFDPSQTQITTDPDPSMPGLSHYSVSLAVDLGADPSTFASLPAGTATMTFSFTGLAAGTQPVHLDLQLTDDSFNSPSVSVDSSVAVSAVPEAPPAAMLAAGLGVLAWLSRRRRS